MSLNRVTQLTQSTDPLEPVTRTEQDGRTHEEANYVAMNPATNATRAGGADDSPCIRCADTGWIEPLNESTPFPCCHLRAI